MHDRDDLYSLDPDRDEPPGDDGGVRSSASGYRIRSEAVWERARGAYLEGETAEAVCDRFDLSLGAFRERARKGGWRRCDQPDREPIPVSALDDVDADADYGELADHALRQLRRAMARGRASAASSWMRLHDRLTARAAEDAKRAEAAARKAAAPRPHSVAAERVLEQIAARRREAEAYVARRDGASATELAGSVALRVGDLARRIAATGPRDGVARAAIDRELDRLGAELRAVSIPQGAVIPDDPDDPDAVFATPPT